MANRLMAKMKSKNPKTNDDSSAKARPMKLLRKLQVMTTSRTHSRSDKSGNSPMILQAANSESAERFKRAFLWL